MTSVLGIDMAKNKFDAALMQDGRYKTKVFTNTPQGFEQLLHWLTDKGEPSPHICMEATGSYGEALATFLFDRGLTVSVVNPTRIKGYAKSELVRTKNDKADSKLIARFCLAMKPAPWQPAPKEIRELQAYVRRLEALQDLKQQEENRLGTASTAVQPSIRKILSALTDEIEVVRQCVIDHIDRHPGLRRQHALLKSIPGVGDITIARFMAEIGDIHRFSCAKQVAAFLGLNPYQRQSGESSGYTTLSKIGHARLRKALYMPALTAIRYNPLIAEFSQRLLAAGKAKMAVVGAAMRKLVHIMYGVLKSGTQFDAALNV